MFKLPDPDGEPLQKGAYVIGYLAYKGKDAIKNGELEGYTGADGTITFTNVPEGDMIFLLVGMKCLVLLIKYKSG
jgi:hypothetical protein